MVCSAWGSTEDMGDYTAAAAEVDATSHRHASLLAVFAAGNSGESSGGNLVRHSPSTVTTQACSKNSLAGMSAWPLIHCCCA